ncbi:MAG: mobilization protein, partial [Bacteroides acidifaciens]
ISFRRSRIDRSMSFYKLDRLFGSHSAEGMEWKPRVPDNGFDGRTPPTMQGMATDSHAAGTFTEQPSLAGAETDGNGSSPVESGSNIVQVTIGALMELCVQPHQAKVSSGGGGGGNESDWGDNDNEKDKLKPRRRRR